MQPVTGVLSLCNGENLSDYFFHKLTALPVCFDQFTDLSDNRIRIHTGLFAHLSNGRFAHHDLTHRRIQHSELINANQELTQREKKAAAIRPKT